MDTGCQRLHALFKTRFETGGMGDEIRGKTKLEAYKKFRARVNRKKIEDATGLYMDAGNGGKQYLYRAMRKDPESGEWVLYFHFGK
jgi:hypothetical protein